MFDRFYYKNDMIQTETTGVRHPHFRLKECFIKMYERLCRNEAIILSFFCFDRTVM